jgi:hypothetical protein
MMITLDLPEALSYEIVYTAATTCLANRRSGIFESISIPAAENPADGWNLRLVALNKKDGSTLLVDLLRPVDERSPFAASARERLAGGERLAMLLDLLPEQARGEVIRIPLTRD